METIPLEVYSADSNYAVIKPPGRDYPGAVIQGDSLSILCKTAKSVAEKAKARQFDDKDFLYDLQDLLHSLLGRLAHYQQVLVEHGIDLPYSRRIEQDDFIELVPKHDDEDSA